MFVADKKIEIVKVKSEDSTFCLPQSMLKKCEHKIINELLKKRPWEK